MTAIVKYNQKDEISEYFSANSNARLIWGGDETIRNFRDLSTPERCVDIAFSDRYSFCLIKAEAVLALDEQELYQLAVHFYNDTYLMDQNACSSPHLVVWLGELQEMARERFWSVVYRVVCKKYDLLPVHAIDKLTILCQNAIDLDQIKSVTKHGNLLYRILMETLPEDMDTLRGKFGYFYEFDATDINQISHIVNKKFQTLTYFGLKKSDFINFMAKNRFFGIDNITPIGSALDIGVFWDGYDIIRCLSRTINVK